VPVRIVNLNDAEALEARLVEGFKALLDLEEPTYNQLCIECLKGCLSLLL
jgi:hypothetical protein